MDTDSDLAVADLATVPEYCRATPGEEMPSFGKPMSSIPRTCGRTTATARRANRPPTRHLPHLPHLPTTHPIAAPRHHLTEPY